MCYVCNSKLPNLELFKGGQCDNVYQHKVSDVIKHYSIASSTPSVSPDSSFVLHYEVMFNAYTFMTSQTENIVHIALVLCGLTPTLRRT